MDGRGRTQKFLEGTNRSTRAVAKEIGSQRRSNLVSRIIHKARRRHGGFFAPSWKLPNFAERQESSRNYDNSIPKYRAGKQTKKINTYYVRERPEKLRVFASQPQPPSGCWSDKLQLFQCIFVVFLKQQVWEECQVQSQNESNMSRYITDV